MQRHGEIVALLNERQLLVRMLSPDEFVLDREFSVFESKAIPEVLGETKLELPKAGRLRVEAVQSDGVHCVMTAWSVVRERRVKRPSALSATILGISAAMADIEEIQTEVVGSSATLEPSQVLNVRSSDAVRVGDFVSGN